MALNLEQAFLRREELPITHGGRYVTEAPIHPSLMDINLDFDRRDLAIAVDLALKDWRKDLEEHSRMDFPESRYSKMFLETLSVKQSTRFRISGHVNVMPLEARIEFEYMHNGFIKGVRWHEPYIHIADRAGYTNHHMTKQKQEFYANSKRFDRHKIKSFIADSLLNRIGMHAVNMGIQRAYEKGILKL